MSSSVTQSLAPALLVAMPQMMDPNFARTVVVLCRHSEEGAFGLVVNRPMLTSARVAINLDPPATTDRELQVWIGGPVEPDRSWLLVGEEPPDDDESASLQIAKGLYLSASPDLLRRSLDPSPPPRLRLVVGYAGWGPGQLDEELMASAWLVSDVDADLVFDTPSECIWEAAIRRLGADPAMLQMSKGVH